jgi:hypothetical protein
VEQVPFVSIKDKMSLTQRISDDSSQRDVLIVQDGSEGIGHSSASKTALAAADCIEHPPLQVSVSFDSQNPTTSETLENPGVAPMAAAVSDASSSSLVLTRPAQRRGRKPKHLPAAAAHMTAQQIDQWRKEERRQRNRALARDFKQREKDRVGYLEQQRDFYRQAYLVTQRKLSASLQK